MKNLLTFIFALALCWPAVAQTKSIVTPLATTSTDNGLLRYDGTTGQLVQAATGMTYSDNRALTIGGATLTVASEPILDLSQTWNNAGVTFTGLKYNVTDTASAAASLLMDLQVGGASRLNISKPGNVTFAGGNLVSGASAVTVAFNNSSSTVALYADLTSTYLRSATAAGGFILQGSSGGSAVGYGLKWSSGGQITSEADGIIQLGADAATATAQSLKAHDGSGTDKDGANITFSGGKSTGTGRGGSVIISTSLTSITGSSANNYSTREYHNAKPVDITESAATTIVTVAVAAGEYVSFDMYSTIFASDGTDHQALPTRINVSAVNKAGTVTPTITAIDGTTAASTGTLSCTYTAAASGNNVIVQANAVSSLTQTVLRSKWSINALNGNGTAAVTVP